MFAEITGDYISLSHGELKYLHTDYGLFRSICAVVSLLGRLIYAVEITRRSSQRNISTTYMPVLIILHDFLYIEWCKDCNKNYKSPVFDVKNTFYSFPSIWSSLLIDILQGVPGFATGCTCGVWRRGLTSCLLYMGPCFWSLVWNDSGLIRLKL